MQRVTAHERTFEQYLSAEKIQHRILALGKEIHQQYAEKNPIFIGVLNGAFIFTADLVRACKIHCEISFIKVSSYKGMDSTGKLTTQLGLNKNITGRHIILVEDIVDTGNTFSNLLPELQKETPESIAIATLLLKPDALQYNDLPLTYVGFEIPNKFVIGYGLDYDESGRQWDSIYQLVS